MPFDGTANLTVKFKRSGWDGQYGSLVGKTSFLLNGTDVPGKDNSVTFL